MLGIRRWIRRGWPLGTLQKEWGTETTEMDNDGAEESEVRGRRRRKGLEKEESKLGSSKNTRTQGLSVLSFA